MSSSGNAGAPGPPCPHPLALVSLGAVLWMRESYGCSLLRSTARVEGPQESDLWWFDTVPHTSPPTLPIPSTPPSCPPLSLMGSLFPHPTPSSDPAPWTTRLVRPHLSLPFAWGWSPSCSTSTSLVGSLGLALGVTYSGRGHPGPCCPWSCVPQTPDSLGSRGGGEGTAVKLLFPATLHDFAGAAVTGWHSPRWHCGDLMPHTRRLQV